MNELLNLALDPAAWLALVTLVVMEVVLGIDNLVFISILSNKLPAEHRQRVRRIGISLALIMRLVLLSTIAFIVGLVHPVFDLGIVGPLGSHGEPSFETAFSWRDLILLAGGLFLIWKATKEIHHTVDPGEESNDVLDKTGAAISNVGAAIFQIILLDLVFSIDSILTAVGMTDHLPIMVAAVLIAVTVMLLAADPLANFINRQPDGRHAGPGFPADDRHGTDRRSLRHARAQGLHLHGHGLLWRGRGPQHDVAQGRG